MCTPVLVDDSRPAWRDSHHVIEEVQLPCTSWSTGLGRAGQRSCFVKGFEFAIYNQLQWVNLVFVVAGARSSRFVDRWSSGICSRLASAVLPGYFTQTHALISTGTLGLAG